MGLTRTEEMLNRVGMQTLSRLTYLDIQQGASIDDVINPIDIGKEADRLRFEESMGQTTNGRDQLLGALSRLTPVQGTALEPYALQVRGQLGDTRLRYDVLANNRELAPNLEELIESGRFVSYITFEFPGEKDITISIQETRNPHLEVEDAEYGDGTLPDPYFHAFEVGLYGQCFKGMVDAEVFYAQLGIFLREHLVQRSEGHFQKGEASELIEYLSDLLDAGTEDDEANPARVYERVSTFGDSHDAIVAGARKHLSACADCKEMYAAATWRAATSYTEPGLETFTPKDFDDLKVI